MTKDNSKPAENTTKETVLAFIKALNEEDFQEARKHVNEDLSFVGVLGSRDGAEAYFKDMEKMKMKYDIKKVFSEGDDVCLFYDFTTAGITVFGCGWYHLVHGKISSFKVIFDPRSILENSHEK